METGSGEKYDVIAVNDDTNVVSIIAEGKSLKSAEAIVTMCVMRRGVETEFFTEVPAGQYKEGDIYGAKGADHA